MKNILSAIILTFAIGGFFAVSAQGNGQQINLRVGEQQRVASRGERINVRFIKVLEDSRCPMNARCVWAGNAKIQIEVSNRTGREIFELNTGRGQKSVRFDGHRIELVNVSPDRRTNTVINRNRYRAVIEVARLSR